MAKSNKLNKQERKALKQRLEKRDKEQKEQENKEVKKRFFWVAVLVIIVSAVGYIGATGFVTLNAPQKPEPVTEMDKFAYCLTESGAKMYGAYWCPHCRAQKSLFEDSFKFVDYVECDPRGENPRVQMCYDAGIKGYPTWEINGLQYPGLQPLDKLSSLTGCKL